MINNNNNKLILIIIGSFLAQIVQVGVFPLYLAQRFDGSGASLFVIGWLLAIQWGAVLAVAPLVPRLSRVFGLANLNKTSGLFTLGGFVCLSVESLPLAVLASVFVGVGLVVRWVTCDTLIVKFSSSARVGRSIGLHETMMGFGIAVGPLFFAFLVLEQVYYLAILITVLSILVFVFNHQQANYTEDKKNSALLRNDFFILKSVFLIALVGGFIETAAVALFPFYFALDGFSLQNSAWFISAFGLGGTLLQLPLGFLVDKIGYRYAQLLACGLGLLGIVGLFFASSSFWVIYGVLFIFGGAVGAFNTLAVIQAGSEIAKKQSASAMSYIAVSYTIGSIIGPIVTANILNYYSGDVVLLVYFIIIATVTFLIAKSSLKNV